VKKEGWRQLPRIAQRPASCVWASGAARLGGERAMDDRRKVDEICARMDRVFIVAVAVPG